METVKGALPYCPGFDMIATQSRWHATPPMALLSVPAPFENLRAELELLRKENAAFRKEFASRIRLKVTEKGAVSVYGIRRFPVTLYKEQWLKLLDIARATFEHLLRRTRRN
jgi:hypothetical protein